MAKEISIVCDGFTDGLRIDKFLSENCAELSRSYIQKLIAQGLVTVGAEPVKASFKVSDGDEIVFTVPDNTVPDIEPEDIPLDIFYEDADILIVNKPKGMVVHPALGVFSGTLVNALMFHCAGELSGINGVERPGIVHRIDKDTSGLLVCAKTDAAHRGLAQQMADHACTRQYRGVVFYGMKEESEWTSSSRRKGATAAAGP